MASRPYVDIYFGPNLPDYGGAPNSEIPGYLTDAVGLRSTPNGYRGMPTFTDVSSGTAAGSAFVYGVAAGFVKGNSLSQISLFFVNDSGHIYESRAEGTDWTEVSPASGTVNYDGDFVRFGDDVMYISSSKAPQVKDLGASLATVFANLSGSPPTGSCAARVRQHVVIGQAGDTHTIRTSAIGDHTDWPTAGTADARSKESISEDVNPEYGQPQRILGGEKFGIICQERALTRMTYIGGAAAYEFDTFERKIGVSAGMNTHYFCRPVTDGKFWYFYNESGLYVTDGYTVKSLSSGRVNEALFLNGLSHARGASLTACNSSAYDRRRGLVIFSNEGYSGSTTYQLVYDTNNGSITWLQHTNTSVVFNAPTGSSTVNLRDDNVYNMNGSNRKLQRMDVASTPTISMQTAFIEVDPGYRVELQGAHLLGTGVPGSLTLAYKSTSSLASVGLSQSGYTSLTAQSIGMKHTARARDQFFSFRITGTGAESQLLRGIRIYYERGEPA